MNEAQIEALANANAFLNNAGLPLIQERVVQVQVRSVYGNALIYPVNQAAQLIANIAGTRTLSRANLAAAQQLGFQIQEEAPALQLVGVA